MLGKELLYKLLFSHFRASLDYPFSVIVKQLNWLVKEKERNLKCFLVATEQGSSKIIRIKKNNIEGGTNS